MAFSWTNLTNAASTRLWEHINNLAAAVEAALAPNDGIFSSATVIASSPTIAPLAFTTVSAPASMWTAGAPTRIVAAADGLLFVSVTVGWSSSSGERYVGLRVNGTTDYPLMTGALTASTSFGQTFSGSTGIPVTAGDYVQVYIAQVNPGSATVTPTVRAFAKLT